MVLCHRDVVLKIKHDPQGGVDATHLLEAEIAHAIAEPSRIGGRSLFS